jgi:hypothetical protein
MACSHPIVDYVSGNYAGCCETAQSICDWLSIHSGGVLRFGGCFGYQKKTQAGVVSIHATGRAIDVNVANYRVGSPQNAAALFLIKTYIMPNVCTLGIQRMIFEGRIWTSGEAPIPPEQWTLAPQTALHTTALHIEITPDECGKWRYQDVNAVMLLTSSAVFTGGTKGSITNPYIETLAPSATGNGVDGTASGGGISPSPQGAGENSASDTNPVWSSVVWELSPCSSCGDQFNTLQSADVIQQTHCGGTGGICINKTNGQTCSVGTAPDIGDFPGAVRDFIWWGNGAYALSENGMNVYYLGDAVEPVFEPNMPDEVGPWESIYGVGPSTIAVSKITPFGPRSLRATVNSIADYSCCEPATDAAPPTLGIPFVLYNFLLDEGVDLQGRGTKGSLFSAAIDGTVPFEYWENDQGPPPVTGPTLGTLFESLDDFDGDWCAGPLTLLVSAGVGGSFDATFLLYNGPSSAPFSPTNGWRITTYGLIDPSTGYVYMSLENLVANTFWTAFSVYVDLSAASALETLDNMILLTLDLSDVLNSTCYVNGSFTTVSTTLGVYTCSEVSESPATYPAEWRTIEVDIQDGLGQSPVRGVALARGYPSQTDLEYWQQFDWSTNEGFAP